MRSSTPFKHSNSSFKRALSLADNLPASVASLYTIAENRFVLTGRSQRDARTWRHGSTTHGCRCGRPAADQLSPHLWWSAVQLAFADVYLIIMPMKLIRRELASGGLRITASNHRNTACHRVYVNLISSQPTRSASRWNTANVVLPQLYRVAQKLAHFLYALTLPGPLVRRRGQWMAA